MEALLRERDNSVRDILAETVRLVAQVDFPDEWPDLVPTVVTQLQTGEVLRYELLGIYVVVIVVVASL